MQFNQTQTYVNRESELNESIDALKRLLDHMITLPRTSAQRSKLRRALKVRAKNLADIRTLRCFTMWDLVHMLAEVDGTLWTDEEARFWDLEVDGCEGRGEKSMRRRLGLNLAPNREPCDLPNGEEVKNWQGSSPDGTFNVETIRVGQSGKKSYGRALRSIIRATPDDALDEERWEALVTGEVSASRLWHGLPETIRETLVAGLAPERVMDCYAAVNGTSRLGYVRIPRDDYAAAWSLVSVTQMGPKYRLKREYVVDRLLRSAIIPVEAA